MTRRDFAKKAECHETHLHKVLHGKKGMSLKLAVKVEEIVEGEFTAATLLKIQQDIMRGLAAEAAQ